MDQGPGRLDRSEPVIIRADGVMLDLPVDVALFLIGLGDPVVEDGLVQDGDLGVLEPVLEHLAGLLRLLVPQEDVGVDRVIVDRAFLKLRPAQLPVVSLAFFVLIRQERVFHGQSKAVVSGVEGLVVESDVVRILGGGSVHAKKNLQRYVVHAGDEIALRQVQFGIEMKLRVSGLPGNPVLDMGVQEGGIQVVLEIAVEDSVV